MVQGSPEKVRECPAAVCSSAEGGKGFFPPAERISVGRANGGRHATDRRDRKTAIMRVRQFELHPTNLEELNLYAYICILILNGKSNEQNL
jgi:hypothetical protein